MKLIPVLAAAAALGSASAFAAPIDFEAQPSFAALDLTPYGLTASAALYGLSNDGGGSGVPDGAYFSNNGSNVVAFATDPAASITSSAGLSGSIAFDYAAIGAGTVYARNAQGDVIGQFDFTANSNALDLTSAFNTWQPGVISFSGVAKTIDFSNATGEVFAFDNLDVTAVPLPAGIALLPMGLAALGLRIRRRRPA